MATTSNFGWETPDDTDLVKDGALAIRTLGNNIDTSLVDLKGGTTGQVLSKNSNTDLDYVWVTTNDADAIQNTIVDAKGDIISATAADTPARLAVGANETRLVADSATATGLKYVADTTNYAIAAKGDLLAGTAADTLAALSVGTNNYFLTPDSTTATGLKWGGDWTAFTPAWTGLTIGNGTTSGRYIQVGKSVFLTAVITLGSTSSVTGQINMTLPNSWTAKTANAPSGLCQLKDTGVAFYAGFCIPGTTAITLQRVGVTGGNTFFGSVDATNPFTWGNTDQIELAINLEIQ